MMRQTGGSPFGWISTRSMPASSASASASSRVRMPSCSASAPITRTRGTRISWLRRLPLLSVVAIPRSSRRSNETDRSALSAGRFGLQSFDESRPAACCPDLRRNGYARKRRPFPSRGHRPRGDRALSAWYARGFYSRLSRCANRTCTRKPLSTRVCVTCPDVIGLGIGDIEHHRLHRGQPGRQQTGVVLDQDADEALHRADDGPVQHHRVLLLRMLVHVFGAQALGHHEIHLHGADLPGAADRVLQVILDLRGRRTRPRPAAPPIPRRRRAAHRAGISSVLSQNSSEPSRFSGRSASLIATSVKPKSR